MGSGGSGFSDDSGFRQDNLSGFRVMGSSLHNTPPQGYACASSWHRNLKVLVLGILAQIVTVSMPLSSIPLRGRGSAQVDPKH